MLNYWALSRPKRKLTPVPDVLTTIALEALNYQWQGDRGRHLSVEEQLERAGLKRVGDRRDRGGGGGRTYAAWLSSLGLIFKQHSTGQLKLTLAGEALINGQPPVEVIKNQVLKFQYPSTYSLSRSVNISQRFRIRPFRFLLRLLTDSRLEYYLTQEEIAKIVTTEAETETDAVYENIVNQILRFRSYGDSIFSLDDFAACYPSSKEGVQSFEDTVSRLSDNANVFINWLEYTQLAARDHERRLRIFPDKMAEVHQILNENPPFIPRPDDEEYFQRRFGVDPWHRKDTRDLSESETVTHELIARRLIRHNFIRIAGQRPILRVDRGLIQEISDTTGILETLVESELSSFPDGALDSFEAAYFDMALKGREQCREFELATTELFRVGFGFDAEHIGPRPLHPDVLVISTEGNYSGIIDTKAYSNYSINNDHRNRMIYNYIPRYENQNLQFFMYMAGGFSSGFATQLAEIASISRINGSGITAINVLRLLKTTSNDHWPHEKLLNLFQSNREIKPSDFV